MAEVFRRAEKWEARGEKWEDKESIGSSASGLTPGMKECGLHANANENPTSHITHLISQLTGIDSFFLHKIRAIADLEKVIGNFHDVRGLDLETVRQAKRFGFSDLLIGRLTGVSAPEIRQWRYGNGIRPVYKMVDTCAAEFEAATPYFYSTYDLENEAQRTPRRKVLVIGGGPIRIGQGIEFDYCSVHSVMALKQEQVEALIINNNPETVSTDFDTADRLYFEPLALEDVLNVVELERPDGVIVQFGGQTAINLAGPLAAAGVPILGTSVDKIDEAEDRERFEQLLTSLGIRKPPGRGAAGLEEAMVDRPPDRLPGPGAAFVRAGRQGDGDRLRRGGPGEIRGQCRGGLAQPSGADRQVLPGPGDRGRRRL